MLLSRTYIPALCFLISGVVCLRLTEVVVPPVVDIHEHVTLSCHFDTDDEILYSVKWYKDEFEFFRFMPGNHPKILIFPRIGVLLDESLSDRTSVTLTSLSFNSSGSYRCEISTEAPHFNTVFASNNLTVMVLPTSEPEIIGLQGQHNLGDLINITCSSAWSYPAPSLTWYINGAKAEEWQLVTSAALARGGLLTLSLGLQFTPRRRHFQGPHAALEVRCRATIPPLPPWERLAVTRLAAPHRRLHNQRLAEDRSPAISWRSLPPSLQSAAAFLAVLLTRVT